MQRSMERRMAGVDKANKLNITVKNSLVNIHVNSLQLLDMELDSDSLFSHEIHS